MSDLKRKIGLIVVQICPKREFVIVTLEDGLALEFPAIWLRDNCQCDKCFNSAMNFRTMALETLDVNVKPVRVSATVDSVSVQWSDQHSSIFPVKWLLNRSFAPNAQRNWMNETYRPPKVPWCSKKFPGIMKRFKFNDIINKDDSLLAWLETMTVNGVAIIEETPSKVDQVQLLADRVAFVKKTHYGDQFEVKATSDVTGAINLAYLAVPLELHTDIPYYEYKPGLNMLHCLVQTLGQGGENQLTDCVHICNILKVEYPEAYEILTKTPVEWNNIGKDDVKGKFYTLYRAPVICLDHSGKFDRVNYSQQQRDSHFKVPLDKVIPWYKALKTFTYLLHHSDNTVFFKTKPGEILVFDNIRMVHGRAGYTDVPGNERHLVGVYLDWDFVYSKLRVLKRDKYPEQYI